MKSNYQPMKNKILENLSFEKILDEIAEVAGYLWQREWAERNAGNISINITGLLSKNELKGLRPGNRFQVNPPFKTLHGQVFLMTGTGTRMRDLAKNPSENICIVIVDEKSQVSYFSCRESKGRTIKPTSEIYSHLAIQQMLLQKDGTKKVVLHTHVTEFIALTQIRKFQSARAINGVIWSMHPETIMFCPKGAGFVPYILPGTPAIAQKTVKVLSNHDVVVWGKHGGLVVAPTLSEAFDTIDLLAKSVKIFLTCRNSGFEPDGLSPQELHQIRRSTGD